jgi:hypothetical protein
MTSLSAILAEIETSAESVKQLETDLAAATERRKGLVARYSVESRDLLRALGIETVRERKARSQSAVLKSSAARAIRLSVKGGEKNAKTILAAAFAAADKTAKEKLGLAEVPADIKTKIEERVKNLAKK